MKSKISGDDPYARIAGSLWLLDLLHRVVLPRAGRDLGRFLRERQAVRVLDVACGTGAMLCALKGSGRGRTGIDRSRAMLRQAARKAGGCWFVEGDARALPFSGGALDAAIVTLALHEMPMETRERAWREMARVVRRGGVLAVMDFTLPTTSLMSRLAGHVVQRVERAAAEFDPAHWENSRQFFQGGGLDGWLEVCDEIPIWSRAYLWGNIRLAAVLRG